MSTHYFIILAEVVSHPNVESQILKLRDSRGLGLLLYQQQSQRTAVRGYQLILVSAVLAQTPPNVEA